MKCQKCNNVATFHITEMTGDEPIELHFCEKHANEYLHKSQDKKEDSGSIVDSAHDDNLDDSTNMSLEQTTRDLKELDFQSCPICGAGFQDFRKSARFGCPNDYKCFAEQVEPLLQNIHGYTDHIGKRPKNGLNDSKTELFLLRLRREMDEAVEMEDYERASRLRDKINALETVSAPSIEQK